MQKCPIIPIKSYFSQNYAGIRHFQYVFIKNLKSHSHAFNINNFINFTSGNTWLAASSKLHQRRTIVLSSSFYFNCIPRIWNALSIINCTCTIKNKLTGTTFNSNDACTLSFLCPCGHCNKSPNPPNFDEL